MNRLNSLNALLLYWHQLPSSLQILLLLLGGISCLWGLFAIAQTGYTLIKTRMMYPELSSFVDAAYLQNVWKRPITRWGFLPKQGMVPLLDYFVERFDTQPALERNFYLLLGPSGSGKTHFLLRLYAKFSHNGLFKRRVKYISLAQMADLSSLAEYEDASNTVLLLDGLDEDSLVYGHFGERLDHIILHTQQFHKIIMACSHARFAELENLNQAHYTFVGPKQSVRFNLCELVPIEGTKSIRPSVRLGVRKYKKAQNRLLQDWPEIAETPLWLESLGLSPVRETDRYYYQLFAYRVQAELGRLYRKPGQTEAAERFLEAIAGSMAIHWQEDRPLQLDVKEAESLATAFGLDWRPLQRQILMILDGGVVVFRHISYLSFFLSRAAYRDELKPNLTQFIGLPLARTFYLEMAWLKFWDSYKGAASYRSRYDKTKRSLKELNAWELPLISRLYLEDIEGLDVRFLRMLKHLKGLRLHTDTTKLTDTDWVQELPSHELVLYTNEHTEDTQMWRSRRVGEDLKIREIDLVQNLNPDLKLSPLFWPKINKGRKDILELFELDFENLPNDHCEYVGTEMNEEGERLQRFQSRLGLLEFSLFNELEIVQFSDQTYNLILRHTHKPTMLEETVTDIVAALFKVYGEDDLHRTLLNDDDLSQIEDGLWLGRKYTWQNTDFYAYPLYLYMDQAQQIQLVMCGLSPELVSELSA